MRVSILKRFRSAIAFMAAVSILFGSTAIVMAQQTATTTISSVIGSVISISSLGTVNDNVTPSGSGAQTIQSDTVTISTNDISGYTLGLAETSTASTLVNTVNGTDTIPASSGSQTTPVVMAVNTWGYRVDGQGGFGAGPTSAVSSAAISGTIKFAAVPATASPNTIATGSGTATDATTTVWYGVAVNTSQPSGTYTNSVTYTATAE
jgi:hypothetical protein